MCQLPPFRVVAFALLCFTAVFAQGGDKAEKKTRPTLTPDQRAKVNKLLSEYRAAGSDVKKKQAVVEKVLDIGPVSRALDACRRGPRFAAEDQKIQRQVPGRRRRRLEARRARSISTKSSYCERRCSICKSWATASRTRSSPRRPIRRWPSSARYSSSIAATCWTSRRTSKPIGRSSPTWAGCGSVPDTDAQRECGRRKNSPPTFESYLLDEENLAVSLAAPLDPRTRAVLAMNAKLAEKIDPEEARAILELNLTRNLLGLPALAIDLNLCEAARDHSTDMEKQGFFSHESPVAGKKTPWDRAKRFGTTASAENIFKGTKSGKAANDGWFHSPGHHRNQMGNHTRVGVGRSGGLFTQMFGR